MTHTLTNNREENQEKEQVHCLEDACILLRVPSGRLSKELIKSTDTDTSLQAFVEQLKTPPSEQNADNLYEKNNIFFEQDFDEDVEVEQIKSSLVSDECLQFVDTITFAKNLVNNVVEESEAKVGIDGGDEEREEEGYDEKGVLADYRASMEFDYVDTRKAEVVWPTVAEFTVEIGAYTIDEYLSTFDTEEDWMYVIYYQGKEDCQASYLHKYQAIYSLPTWKYPIAQATASIFFTVEVSKTKPLHCFVDVTFSYETFRRIYNPIYHSFQEKWLHHILDAKIKLFQTVTY